MNVKQKKEILQTQLEELESVWCKAWEPPPQIPMWKWWEENIWLDRTAAAQGKFSTKLVPMVRIWSNWAENPDTRRFVSILSAQSTKTQNAINTVLYKARARPGTLMWIMASKDSVEEFRKKRLEPAIEDCEAIRDMLPRERKSRTKSLIQLDSMNIILRGSNSRVGLQSDPVSMIICDERREWSKGAIDLVRKRLRTFSNAIEISIGTAGPENDELHMDWQDGSQGFIHWKCLDCGHSQPYRFGRKESPFWPEPRKKGGIHWSPDAKIDGEWNEKLVKESAEYECEHCGCRYKDHQKLFLLNSMHEFHRRPEKLPESPSLHWGALYMPWASCSWGGIAWEFILANQKLKYGNPEPLRAFITETLGEPWREEGENVKPNEILERRQTYKIGERWPESSDTVSILTVDVQAGCVVVVERQWKRGGTSRLIKPFRLLSLDEVRSYQLENKIKDLAVFLDCAYQTREVLLACLKYNWNAMLGDDAEEFTQMVHDPAQKKNVPIKTYWKKIDVDPNQGFGQAGRYTVRRYSWSKPHYRTKLFFHSMKGTAEPWELPSDIEEWDAKEDKEWRYMKQMANVRRIAILGPKNEIIGHEWKEDGRHDFPDCELMQQAAADICGLTKGAL